jgi:hypothetical protein
VDDSPPTLDPAQELGGSAWTAAPKPTASTRVDDDCATLRIDMQTLFDDLGIAA